MKFILILLIIAGGVYSFLKPADPLDRLMNSADTASITKESGIKNVSSRGSSNFNVNNLAIPGQITVVDFYVSWCSACKKLSSDYKIFNSARPDVVIRRLKMKDKWNVAWAKRQYNLDIRSTPHVLIFDTQGQLISEDAGTNKQALQLLYKWMNKEVRKS